MSKTEELKARLTTVYTEIAGKAGRAFDPTIILTIFTAITTFFKNCRQPTPTPPASTSRAKNHGFAGPEDGPVMVGLRHNLKVATKDQYGRGWRDVWQTEQANMEATARQVANESTKEEIDDLRRELKAHGV